jgi:hypothetical protein
VGVFSPRASPARSSRRRHSRSPCGPGRPKPTPSDDAEPDLDFSDILREDWFALSCRSGTGEAFTAAMPRDLTLEYIAASLLDEAPEPLPLILMENELTAERDHRLVHLYVDLGERLKADFARTAKSNESLTPAAMAAALQRIVKESSMTREQRRRLKQKRKKK